MTVTKNITHYAHSAHGQPNNNDPEAKFKNIWKYEGNASATDVTKAPKGSDTSHYSAVIKKKTKTDTLYEIHKPWTFTAIDYKFEIPKCAYITNIKFEAVIKVDGNISVNAPTARFNFYNGSKTVKDNLKNDNGWNNGFYYRTPSKKLSNSWQTFTYEMSGSEFRKRGYPNSECNRSIFGIDLKWQNPTKMVTSHKVYVKYVKCIISYELPDEQITFDRVTTGDSPRYVPCGDWYQMDITYQNKSNARCCDSSGNPVSRQLKITFPPNAQVTWGSFNDTPYNLQNNTWTVPCTANDWESITFSVRDWGAGLNKIVVSGAGKTWNYWVYSVPQSVDVGYVTGYAGTMQKDVNSCITFIAKVNASDGKADFDVSLVNDYGDMDPVVPASDVNWTLDTERSSTGVSIVNDPEYTNDNHVRMLVPAGEPVDIVFTGCFYPQFTGNAFAECGLHDKYDYGCSVEYTVLEPPIYVVRNKPILPESDRTTEEITLNPSLLRFRTHRVATSTEIGAYIIDCSVANFDSSMIEDKCTLSANVWEKIDYIGCVPLKYHHYDPESTYSNKGISDSYKNKTYKGKEGVIDEKITLKFKAKPTQVPTLQGLVKLDKPTPINANWRCFEGDPLNHRGWVVFSEIKTTRTNPLWYDCDAEVDYLTHDINTKFQIFKELQVNTKKMPEIMAETFKLGSNLSNALNLFNVETDGGFVYDSDGDDGAKNLFSLDEEQYLFIGTRNPLKNVSQLRFDWYSTKIEETRENTMERVFRLNDKDGNTVFEYEYTNVQLYEDYATCDIIVRVKNSSGGWDTQSYNDVDLRTEMEVDPIADDGEEAVEVAILNTDDDEDYYYYDDDENSPTYQTYVLITESDFEGDRYRYDETNDTYVKLEDTDDEEVAAFEAGYIAPSFDPEKYDVTTIYGTSLEWVINGNKLSVYEAGYNGRELAIENIELVKSNSYSFETYWKNHNLDGMTEDVLTYIDIELAETILSTEYAQYYSNIMVSPFPIPHKKVVFTRDSEEGTIFYLTGDEPFKYRIEPYYQFHCGCDLVTRDGVSIFDLNNSYTHFFIENGLVRLGFNKFNGRISLAKWDIMSDNWIPTHYFHMSEDTKFSLNSYSDDKIVIKAGTDTFFTIWRGHPFVGIKNPNNSIAIDSNFNYCFSDKVNGEAYEYPIIFSFLNHDNLFPECIGGTKIDYDCIEVDDDEVSSGTEHTLTLDICSTPVAESSCTLDVTLNQNTTDGSVHYLIDNIDVATVEYPFDLNYTFPKPKEYIVQAVYVGDDDDKVAISEKKVVKVAAPAPRNNSQVANNSQNNYPGAYSLKIVSAPKQFVYRDKQQVVLQLKKGNKVIKGYTIEMQHPNGIVGSTTTDVEGKAYLPNHKSFHPGKWSWGGRFFDATDEDHDRKLILTALKTIEIVKATPTFVHFATDGRINKGKLLVVKLKGTDEVLQNQNVTYTLNGGSKKTKKTNTKGNIHIAMNQKGTIKVKVMYAGNKNYKAVTKTFTIKVV